MIVARWRDSSEPRSGWTYTSQLKKIPTRLAYDQQNDEGPLIAWGEECDGLPADHIKEHFKVFMGDTNFLEDPDTVPWVPCSQQELHRWVRDYLGAFCAHVVDFIDRQATAGWREATFIWNFTVPGTWAEFPVAADFKRLAEDAVGSCSSNAKGFRVSTNMTEARASALCLLAASSVKDKQYSVGSTVISCDIGGATTDVAVSKVSGAGRLATLFQLQIEPVGTVTVEKAFWLHARQTLRSAGAQNPDQLALEMVHGLQFQYERANFEKHKSEDRIRIRLPNSIDALKWQPSETTNTNMSTIENGYLCIHR